ncbi:heme exporter protein CcmD [Thiopseudomonas acetoxidans]|uniref:Heme exporter protein D n=1 Tax=Thiopseudomonas acetoxidans TaxID=3041622 RepID=A0ABT7STM5_9GAMM|nr:heme exporter protein CcmD [Thiopseudomonas sp. CY1220]MDM7858902.1 heme exporter protein CcmD [Thiopseudomonas sp. CY1220]NLC10585.1 heme exporter protein CcmD [Gammaproteobacteria bacterium]
MNESIFAFNSFAEFIAMGKHGFYVWVCFGITIAVLAINVALPWLARRRYLNQEARRLRWEAMQ